MASEEIKAMDRLDPFEVAYWRPIPGGGFND